MPKGSEKRSDSDDGSAPVVVGIGASAGGLAALKRFFELFPEDCGLAFVVVVHLLPDHESHLADLLQPHVHMPVAQVTESVPIEPNRVYVIPPGRHLSALDTHLRLSEIEAERSVRMPIDHFFRTLAATHDGHAVGVVLTGTGSDGTLGVREIKKEGGLVVVQDPVEAEYDGMPQTAIRTGMADHVLPLAGMAAAILRFVETRPKVQFSEEQADSSDETRLLNRIFAQLRARTDPDFSRYKRSTVLRRIARRMQINSIEEVSAYVGLLQEQPDEVRSLAEDLLITVTSFFRDAEVYENLENEVIPQLFQGKTSEDVIRAWTVACATGEEAYSLAILLFEAASEADDPPPIQIFASDLHKASLENAREAFYPADIEADVSPERLKRFFTPDRGGYRVIKPIRDLVVFTPHNLLGDPPFSKLNLITCRNLLIYLQRDVQRGVIDVFHYALNPGGYLVLGSSETIEESSLFETENKTLRVYRRRNVPHPVPRLPVFPFTPGRFGGKPAPKTFDEGGHAAYGTIHARMAARHAPPSILVNSDHKVVYLSDEAGRYLIQPGGEPTASVFALLRPELRIELRALFQTARERSRPVRSRPIPVRFNGAPCPVIVGVFPAWEGEQGGLALVTFEEHAPEKESSQRPDPAAGAGEDSRVREFESELRRTKQRLQAVIEEYEGIQEEMRASNEELQSTNEELRSTMEELETSKEELQSMNEELQTVNQENRHKVEELSQLTGDLQNLFAATDIATLFLDRDLRILRFTPKVSDLFNVRSADRGRPISDLTHRLGYADLLSDARRVLKDLIPIEHEIRGEKDRWYLTRILPYRSPNDRILGVVLTFVEITRRVHAERALHEVGELAQFIVENAREYAIIVLDTEGHIRIWNTGARRLFGYAESEILGKPGAVIFTGEDRAAGAPEAELAAATSDGVLSDQRWYVRRDGTRFWASGATQTLENEGGAPRGYFKVLRDETERKQSEETLRRWNETLEDRVASRTAVVRAQEREIQDLGFRLALAEHTERGRIALVLHDDLQQQLYAIQVLLALVRRSAETGDLEGVRDVTTELGERLASALGATSRLATDLSPPVLVEDPDLAAAVRWLAERMREDHGLDVEFSSTEPITVSKEVRVVLFQMLRELLFNVVKHAGTSKASVDLVREAPWLILRVRDCGRGFDAATRKSFRSLGLSSVNHRVCMLGGDLDIDSENGKGTTVTIRIPIERPRPETSAAESRGDPPPG